MVRVHCVLLLTLILCQPVSAQEVYGVRGELDAISEAEAMVETVRCTAGSF